MERYLVFYGHFYYPAGGMDDFVGSYPTLTEAIEKVEEAHKKEWDNDPHYYERWTCAWAHIFDSVEGKIVWKRDENTITEE